MIRQGDSNSSFRVATEPPFDMSANTNLTMKFTSPAGVKSTATSPDVIVPASQVDDPDLGILQASTYMQLQTTTTTFTESGTYTVCVVYEDNTTIPVTILQSGDVEFEIGESC